MATHGNPYIHGNHRSCLRIAVWVKNCLTILVKPLYILVRVALRHYTYATYACRGLGVGLLSKQGSGHKPLPTKGLNPSPYVAPKWWNVGSRGDNPSHSPMKKGEYFSRIDLRKMRKCFHLAEISITGRHADGSNGTAVAKGGRQVQKRRQRSVTDLSGAPESVNAPDRNTV
jgi:hypothetical protein